MKGFFQVSLRSILAICFVLPAFFSSGQNSQGFETYSSNLVNLRNDCWTPQGYSFVADNTMEGLVAVRSSPLSGFTPVNLGSPWIRFAGTGSIVFKHRVNNTSSSPRLTVSLVSRETGVSTPLITHFYTSAAVVTTTLPVTVSGIYRIIFTSAGAGGTGSSRIHVDDISYPGTDVADRNNNPGGTGLCECVQTSPDTEDDLAVTDEDNSVSLDVLANDTDPDNDIDPASLTIATQPANGQATVNPSGGVIYTPAANFTGNDSFVYSICDGANQCSTGTVQVTVNPVNDPPTALADQYTTPEDTPLTVAAPGILQNDTDLENDPLSAVLVTSIAAGTGTLTLNANGSFSYNPAPDFNGSVSFTYRASDGSLQSPQVTVTIDVTPVNDAPVAVPNNAQVNEDASVVIQILGNDTDIDNAINPATLTIITQPERGTIQVNATTGAVTYTPAANYFGNDFFTYRVSDVDGLASNNAMVSITVIPVNDAPVAFADNVVTPEDTPVLIDVLLNDTDIDDVVAGAPIQITMQPSHGTVLVQNGKVNYSPAENYFGNDSFSYRFLDPQGAASNVVIVSIAVTPVNDAPVAVNDQPDRYSKRRPLVIDVHPNDWDVDNTPDQLTLVSAGTPTRGLVRIENGKLVYVPASNESGVITFTYVIQDPDGLTAEGTVTLELYYPPLELSEGFSPNGDQNNDFWYIQGIQNYLENRIQVFDRWGLLVYTVSNYDNETITWNGKSNQGPRAGRLLDQGTYYYVLMIDEENIRRSGHVTIIW